MPANYVPVQHPWSPSAYLSNEPAGSRETGFAFATIFVSAALFVVAVGFARIPLGPFPSFIPIYVTALVICDLITAVLLFGQYRVLRSVALLVLAGGYLFTATSTTAYALIFPGLFAPSGLLGSGPQTSSALYMLWHTGFPLAVMAYVSARKGPLRLPALVRVARAKPWQGIAGVVALVVSVVVLFTAFATSGHAFLPMFMAGDRTTVVGKVFLVGIWLLSLAALGRLWRGKPHTVLDVWLHVVMSVWVFDIALAAVLNTGRYDLGWYVGRIYGLLAAGFLLIVLLSETARQHARLMQVTAELRVANDTLWQISMKDGLTRLANRRSFDTHLAEHLAVAVRHHRHLALVLVDVDHFKDFNDAYGHQAGDECLKSIARALDTCCQRPADLAARYGGEEFAMVLPDTDREGAVHIAHAAQKAVAALQIAHQHSSTGVWVSISSGVASVRPGDGLSAQALIGEADKALYRAKNSGRNQVAVGEASQA
ncbi:GGDEF domain-containing protein [Acidovorax radicis]|uniref:GGDEF domain-containing protein n=1 Tax=Acidovorax radicis TaxID=758826 RepID=UPI0002376A36|nr:diguanylate cyclase [Acidovorax radicis]